MKKSTADPYVYINKSDEKVLIIAVYVDDLLIFSNNLAKEEHLRTHLNKHFKMKNLGDVKQCLSMTIEKDWQQGELYINQSKYIDIQI